MPSNLPDVLAGLDDLRQLGDMTRDRLGERLLDAACNGVRDSAAAECDPDGNRWPKLSPGYAAAKARTHPGAPIGVRDGVMLSPGALAGERSIEPDRAEVTFGDTPQARDELGWFSEGDSSRNRPPRPVVGITSAAAGEIDAILDRHVNDKLK